MLGMGLRKRLESGERRLVWLQGLKGREQRLGPVGLLRRVDNVDLVLEVLRGGLWGHVMNVVDLRGAGVVVGLLDGVGSL